ncbi:MAG: hypothetical protein NTV58_06715 [Deltaproteobacteria bacterium]|nr:hypothetical protein [Deltaproteobacteria bacterium]
MNRGYVKLWRKSLDAGWIRNHKLWAFWTWCLMKASYRDFGAVVGLQIVRLTPGQFIFGLKKASMETGLTIREIRTILYTLSKAGNLTIKTTNKYSVISIINWPTYQGDETENDTQNDKPLTNKRQHTNIKALKNKKPFLSGSIEIRLSELLLERILSRNPNFKKPNLQSWAKDIDSMIRLDSRTPEDIRQVIRWAHDDSFWQGNILSTSKLRKQFDQLQVKMQGINTRGGTGIAPSPSIEEASKCSRCGRRILVKADLTKDGCVYCEARA